ATRCVHARNLLRHLRDLLPKSSPGGARRSIRPTAGKAEPPGRAGERQGDTVWDRLAEVLVRNPELPPYTAVVGWVPWLSVEVVNAACPAASRVAVPRVLFLSLKVTVPVGMAVPGALAVTVAVKVTACPWCEGLSEEVTVVVVPSLFTVCVTAL